MKVMNDIGLLEIAIQLTYAGGHELDKGGRVRVTLKEELWAGSHREMQND
jgi:hypothetical protein